MTDLRTFEVRLERALNVYADDVEPQVDSWAVATRLSELPRRPWDRLWPVAVIRGHVVPAIVLVLVLALLGGLIWVGAPLLFPPSPLPAVEPSGIELRAATSSEGSALVATDGSLWLAQPGRVERFDPLSSTAETWDIGDDEAFGASTIARARDGGVWLVGLTGIRRFDGQVMDPWIAGPSDEWLASVAEAPDGRIWATGRDGGLFRRDSGAWTRVSLPRVDWEAGSVDVDAAGRPVISWAVFPGPTEWGMARLDGAGWTTFSERDAGVLRDPVVSVAAAPDGALWFSTWTGIAVLRDSAWTTVDVGARQPEGGFNLAVSVGGVVWAGSRTGPVVVASVSGLDPEVYDPTDGLPDEPEGAVIALPTGDQLYAAWFGASGHRLLRLAEGRWLDVSGLDDRPMIDGYARLVGGADGDGWVLQQPFDDSPRLWHVTTTTLAGEAVAVEGRPTSVRDLAVGPDGRMWAATDRGVFAGRAGAWTLIERTAASLVAVGQDGRVWAVDHGLVWSLEERTDGWLKVPGPDLPTCVVPDRMVMPERILVDAQGRLWLSGIGGYVPSPGLFRLDGSTWERMSPLEGKDPLASNLALAPNGDVWVTLDGSAPTGTCWDPTGRISTPIDQSPNPSELVARYDGRGWTTYGIDDGISYHEYQRQGLAITPDGTVWLSGAGLNSFDGVSWSQHLEGQFITSIAAPADGSLLVLGWSGLQWIDISPAATLAPAP
jgi:hypothetical protein